MPINDELGKRMKENYEQIPKTRLMRRCPVIDKLRELGTISSKIRFFGMSETKKVKKPKSNPVEAAYDLLIAYRDSNMIPCMDAIEELIGYLGEALE